MRFLVLAFALFPLFLSAQNPFRPSSNCDPYYDSVIHRSYYKYTDEAPVYTGGPDSLYKTLAKQIRYPHNRYSGFEGTVWISFIVETNGRISNLRLVKKAPVAYYNEEALRAAAHLQSWIPGKCNGVPVPTLQYLPVRFVSQ